MPTGSTYHTRNHPLYPLVCDERSSALPVYTVLLRICFVQSHARTGQIAGAFDDDWRCRLNSTSRILLASPLLTCTLFRPPRTSTCIDFWASSRPSIDRIPFPTHALRPAPNDDHANDSIDDTSGRITPADERAAESPVLGSRAACYPQTSCAAPSCPASSPQPCWCPLPAPAAALVAVLCPLHCPVRSPTLHAHYATILTAFVCIYPNSSNGLSGPPPIRAVLTHLYLWFCCCYHCRRCYCTTRAPHRSPPLHMLVRRARRARLALPVHPLRPFHSLAYVSTLLSHDAQPTICAGTCTYPFLDGLFRSPSSPPPLSSIVSSFFVPLVRFLVSGRVFPPSSRYSPYAFAYIGEKSASRSSCRGGWQRIARVVVWRRRCVMYNTVPMLRRRRRIKLYLLNHKLKRRDGYKRRGMCSRSARYECD
ncbi:hypothetical protein C8Q73DRAFT_339471 [Cubamyces lactineus]|nr:hypothetical protein C8Q73DRAFT_339471 [Cubamyces lactineus]